MEQNREGKFNFYNLTDRGQRICQFAHTLGEARNERLVDMFRQVADPTRLQLLRLLAEGERNVGDLCIALDGQSQPAVSHHLAKLRDAGLVEPKRDGKFSYYSLTDHGRD